MESSKLRDEIMNLISDITESDIKKSKVKRTDVNASFIEGVNVDSLMALEIVAALEKKYKVEIKEDDLPKLGTIDDMVDLVEKLTTGKQSDSVGQQPKTVKKQKIKTAKRSTKKMKPSKAKSSKK